MALYKGDYYHHEIKEVSIPNKITIAQNLIDIYKITGNRSLLHPIFDAIIGANTKEVLLLHTAGGPQTYQMKWPDVFAQYLQSRGITTTLVTTLPYMFEGEKIRTIAVKHINILRGFCDKVEYIDAEGLREKYPQMTFYTAYNILDQAVGEKIELILSRDSPTK